MTVTCFKCGVEDKDHQYTFLRGKKTVKNIFTYRRALAFAQGVNLGREISIIELENVQ